jgi:hypothetical protein
MPYKQGKWKKSQEYYAVAADERETLKSGIVIHNSVSVYQELEVEYYMRCCVGFEKVDELATE